MRNLKANELSLVSGGGGCDCYCPPPPPPDKEKGNNGWATVQMGPMPAASVAGPSHRRARTLPSQPPAPTTPITPTPTVVEWAWTQMEISRQNAGVSPEPAWILTRSCSGRKS